MKNMHDEPAANTGAITVEVGPEVPDDFAAFCEDFSSEFAAREGESASESSAEAKRICVSVSPMLSKGCVVFSLAATVLAEFLNRLGDASKARNFVDVQFWLQQRLTKRRDPDVEIYGATIDYDLPIDDPLTVIAGSGVSTPTAAWKTQNGAKFCYVFDRPVKVEEFEIAATHLAMSFDGADPGSWSATHGQNLPIAWKADDGDLRDIRFPATQ